MPPRLVEVAGDPPDSHTLFRIATHVEEGGVVAMPTETVYGFSGLVREGPIRRIQALKSRDGNRPFLVLVDGPGSVLELEWTPWALELAEVFWPGALTLVLNDPKARFPSGVRSPTGTVAVRQSPHPVARGLVETVGKPLISTSLNPAGEAPALSAEEAMQTVLTLDPGADIWILDGGRLPPSEPSTIIDCSGSEARVLRAGSIPVDRVRCVLPELKGRA